MIFALAMANDALERLKAWIDENESGPFHRLVHDVLAEIAGVKPQPAPVQPDDDSPTEGEGPAQ